MKRFFSLFTICCLLVTIFACGNKEETISKEPLPKNSVSKNEKKETATKTSRDMVASKRRVIAKINEDIITLKEFKNKIEILPENSDALLGYDTNTLEGKKRFLEDLISRELLVQEAEKRGINKKKDIVAKLGNLEDLKKQILIAELVKDLKIKISISDEEISDFYNRYKENFVQSEKIRARQIIVKDGKKAKQILVQLLQGANFAMLAKEKSIGPNAGKGGDLGFFSRGEMPKPFDDVVFNLKKGDTSGIIAISDGYHIARLTERKKAKQKDIKEVTEEIKRRLSGEKEARQLQDLLEKLKEKGKIEVNEEFLK
ncbi:MAG: peptidyl-prolyl cis-trans isomerase [Candidatus Omnitrophica bacterium]|nr:peptidyl-prolyl cis-trans isomerase [Candidatus Omnitrophota bacterium]